MNIVKKPIEVISWTDKAGTIRPIRFRMTDNEEMKVIKINKVIKRDRFKIDGIEVIIFRCQSLEDGAIKQFELKFEVETMKWKLYKI